MDGEKGSAPCGSPQGKLEPTDVILSSSHANKVDVLCTKILPLGRIKVACHVGNSEFMVCSKG